MEIVKQKKWQKEEERKREKKTTVGKRNLMPFFSPMFTLTLAARISLNGNIWMFGRHRRERCSNASAFTSYMTFEAVVFVYLKYFHWLSIFSHYFSPHNKHTLPIILINGTQIIQFIFIWIIKTTFVSLLAAIGPNCARSLVCWLADDVCIYLFVSKGIADFGTKCLWLWCC